MLKFTSSLIALITVVHSIPFEQCKHNGGGAMPISLTIEGCENDDPCIFYDGDRVISEALVQAPGYGTETLTTKLLASLLGISMDFPIPENAVDACKHIEGASCPLRGGEIATYRFNETMENFIMGGKVTLEHSVVDDNGKNYACARFQVNIKTGPRPEE